MIFPFGAAYKKVFTGGRWSNWHGVSNQGCRL